MVCLYGIRQCHAKIHYASSSEHTSSIAKSKVNNNQSCSVYMQLCANWLHCFWFWSKRGSISMVCTALLYSVEHYSESLDLKDGLQSLIFQL